ncbi:L-dopachrome tautomerase-related protein [Streptomyces sp. NPDC007863]|uniref:L-dopachrome tautomerase-related protein n=1 Tax=Streptomyces sp. NPDC007863 TaxID=3154894 RepID=UPI0033CEE085
MNREDASDLAGHFQSVQSVVVDPADRLWILDTGNPLFAGSSYGDPKLVAGDLRTNRIVRKLLSPPEVVPSNSYPNDLCFDLRRGAEGMAFITDSGGSNGVIVVDLATGRSWRRLAGHPSVLPDEQFLPLFEGEPLMIRPADGEPTCYETGSDGIALSADGQRLSYSPCPAAGCTTCPPTPSPTRTPGTPRRRRRSSTSDSSRWPTVWRATTRDGSTAATWNTTPSGAGIRTAPTAPSPRGTDLIWVDTLSVASDRHLYATANQLNRMSLFHEGEDLRRKPYLLVRLPIDAGPVRLV